MDPRRAHLNDLERFKTKVTGLVPTVLPTRFRDMPSPDRFRAKPVDS